MAAVAAIVSSPYSSGLSLLSSDGFPYTILDIADIRYIANRHVPSLCDTPLKERTAFFIILWMNIRFTYL